MFRIVRWFMGFKFTFSEKNLVDMVLRAYPKVDDDLLALLVSVFQAIAFYYDKKDGVAVNADN